MIPLMNWYNQSVPLLRYIVRLRVERRELQSEKRKEERNFQICGFISVDILI
jgi:hypothetical protein